MDLISDLNAFGMFLMQKIVEATYQYHLNGFGIFLIVLGAVFPFYYGSIWTLFSKKDLHEADLYRKNLIENTGYYSQNPEEYVSRYVKAKYFYLDIWVNGICLASVLVGLVLICFF